MDLILHFTVVTDFWDKMIKKYVFDILNIWYRKKALGKFPFVQALALSPAVALAPVLAFAYVHASVHVLAFAL